MRFILPLPPSINRTYGVVDSTIYKRTPVKDWEVEAGWHLKKQWNKKPLLGTIQIGITWYVYRDRDIDAGIKVLLDLLQRIGVVANDRQIRKINYVDIYSTSKNTTRVEIDVKEFQPRSIAS